MGLSLDFELVEDEQALAELVQRMASAELIALDTEFVGEYSYRPQLCLIQLALCRSGRGSPELVIVDPRRLKQLDSFWEQLATGSHRTVVHAGRQEYVFCWRRVGRGPARLIDVQVAAGLVGLEYPAGYSNLVQRLLGVSSGKRETRTDWRRRPLSKAQLQYALEDVVHLPPLVLRLDRLLADKGRTAWLREEMQRWEAEIQHQLERETWRRLSGLSGLDRRQLAVARQLWQWRNQVAQQQNRRPSQILRDDLLVELARRASSDPAQITAIRGMEWKRFRRHVDQIARQIAQALALPPEQWPEPLRRSSASQYGTLSQLLYAVLSCHCRRAEVAPPLVGTPNELRQWIARRLDGDSGEASALDRGWRRELLGTLLEDLLEGKLNVWVQEPESDSPLGWERRQ